METVGILGLTWLHLWILAILSMGLALLAAYYFVPAVSRAHERMSIDSNVAIELLSVGASISLGVSISLMVIVMLSILTDALTWERLGGITILVVGIILLPIIPFMRAMQKNAQA